MVPLSGLVTPVMSFMSVVLPQPFGPTTPILSVLRKLYEKSVMTGLGLPGQVLAIWESSIVLFPSRLAIELMVTD